MEPQINSVQTKKVESFFENYLTTLITLASFVSAIAIIFFVGYPRFNSFRSARSLVDVESKKTAAMTNKLNGLKKLDEESLVENAILLKTAVPSDKDITGLVIGLQQLASQNGLSITQFNATPGSLNSSSTTTTTTSPPASTDTGQVAGPQAATGGTTIDFTVTFRGDYGAMENLLSSSTKTLRLLSVKTIKIAPSSAEGSIEMLLNAKAYWKSPGNLGNYEEVLPSLGASSQVLEALSKFQTLSGQPQPLPTGSISNPF